MVEAHFCLNCMTFGWYEEEIHIYECSPFKERKFVDTVNGPTYCLNCEDGGRIILADVDEDVLEKIKTLYGELPLKNNPASAFILLLALADYPQNLRVQLYPIKYIPEGLFDEKMRKEIEKGRPDAVIEAWAIILKDRISKNPNIIKPIQRAIDDLEKTYPEDNVRAICRRIRNVLVEVS